MKRTSVIWILVLAVAVLATVTTTYFLLDLKQKELDKRGESEVTDKSQELTILNAMSVLRDVLQEERNLKELELDGEANSNKVTALEMGSVKLAIPYEINEDEDSAVTSKTYNSEEILVSFEKAVYLNDKEEPITFAETMAKSYKDMNTFLGQDIIKESDIVEYVESFDSTYDLYIELLKTHKDTSIFYESDRVLKNEFIKFYLASELQLYDNVYVDTERKLIFLHNKDEEGVVSGGQMTIFKFDTIYELYVLYNNGATEDEVLKDFSFIIKSMQ